VSGAGGEEALDDAFGQLTAGLVLFLDDEDPRAGLNLTADWNIHGLVLSRASLPASATLREAVRIQNRLLLSGEGEVAGFYVILGAKHLK
jgi:hypothetical protein